VLRRAADDERVLVWVFRVCTQNTLPEPFDSPLLGLVLASRLIVVVSTFSLVLLGYLGSFPSGHLSLSTTCELPKSSNYTNVSRLASVPLSSVSGEKRLAIFVSLLLDLLSDLVVQLWVGRVSFSRGHDESVVSGGLTCKCGGMYLSV
jgi:hypothetical protein